MNRLPYDPESALGWENYVVAQVAQSMLGLLAPEVRAVACRFQDEVVEIHFALPVRTPELNEDIDDICFELDVLLLSLIHI